MNKPSPAPTREELQAEIDRATAIPEADRKEALLPARGILVGVVIGLLMWMVLISLAYKTLA